MQIRILIMLPVIVLLATSSIYARSGELDSSFGEDDKVTTAIGNGEDRAYSVAIQNDGKIVTAGYSDNGSDYDFAVVRYNIDGSLDSSFGTGGIVTTDAGGDHDEAMSIAIQKNGKIVVAGGRMISGAFDFVVVRYNTDGTPDTSFGTDGIVTTNIGDPGYANAKSVAIQSDGKIIAAGIGESSSGYNFAIVRYNTDGTTDTSFGTGGIVTTDVNGSASSVTIQDDGKIIAAGDSYDGDSIYYFALIRYNTNGTLDTTFGTGGMVTTNIGPVGDSAAKSLLVQKDGKIVAAGSTMTDTHPYFALTRYNSNGTPDTSFGTDGVVITEVSSADGASSVTIQDNGKIVATGGMFEEFNLVRYNTNGTPDTSFGIDGIVTTDVGGGVSSVTIQKDGKIVTAGWSDNSSDFDFAVVRYVGDPVTTTTTSLSAIYYLLD